jgi:hypothetical protein
MIPCRRGTLARSCCYGLTSGVLFGNCLRYVPTIRFVTDSVHVPRAGTLQSPPQWKTRPVWSEVLPAAEPARLVKPDSGAA